MAKYTQEDLDKLRALARTSLWVGLVWNDHNFNKEPLAYMQETIESIGISTVAEANILLDKFKEDEIQDTPPQS